MAGACGVRVALEASVKKCKKDEHREGEGEGEKEGERRE